MKREKEFHAIKLHSLESYAQSFLQIIIQVYFLFLLLLLGTGTVIAGVSVEKFFQDICKYSSMGFETSEICKISFFQLHIQIYPLLIWT